MGHPGNGRSARIERLYVWLAEQDDGTESIVSCHLRGDQTPDIITPLVGAGRDQMGSLRGYARAIGVSLGQPVRLVEFCARIDLEQEP